MTELIGVIGVYTVIGLIAARIAGGAAAWRCQEAYPTGGKLDGDDLTVGVVAGIAAGALWPAILTIVVLFTLLRPVARAGTGRLPKIGAEARAAKRLDEERFKRIEREVLGDDL